MPAGFLRTSLTGLLLGGILSTSAQAEAGGSSSSTDRVGEGLLVQLIYLPVGLLIAALILEVIARSRGTKELHRGVPALLVGAAISACIALVLSAARTDWIGPVAGSPFASTAAGTAFVGLTILACIAKALSLRAPVSGSNATTGAAPPRKRGRGRGRGRRRRAASRPRASAELLGAAAKGIYALSLAAALAVPLMAAWFSDPQPPDSPIATAVNTEDPEPAEDLASMGEITPDPLPEPAALPVKPATDATNGEARTADSGGLAPPIDRMVSASDAALEPRPESEMVVEPAPNPDPTPDAATAALATVEPAPETGTSAISSVEPAPKKPSKLESGSEPVTPPTAKPAIARHGGLAGAETYKKLVQPILRSRCYDCHGEDKQKGDLRLDTAEGIRLGGKSGPAIIAGAPEKSYLFELISLEESDDDIMPPKGKALSSAQISWIGGWIREGAALGDGVPWPVADGGADSGGADPLSAGIPTADASAIQLLLDGGVIVRPVSTDGNLLEIDYSHADRAAGEMRLDELRPIAANIHTLDLKKTKVADADLEVISAMEALRVLHLQRTKIGDVALQHLSGLSHLESLNLYSTQVSDAGLTEIKKLTSLRKVYLWSSQVTAEGARDLAGVLGAEVVNMGE